MLRWSSRIAMIYGAILFVCLYVHATMNALHEGFQPGIESFKRPFYLGLLALLLATFAALLTTVFSSSIRRRYRSVLRGVGISAMVSSALILFLGRAPCFEIPTTWPVDSTSNSVEAVVEHSFLCPRYSVRSYPLPILFGMLGIALAWIAHRTRSVAITTLLALLTIGTFTARSEQPASEPASARGVTQADRTTPTDLIVEDCLSCGEGKLRTLDPIWFPDFGPGRYVEPMALTGGIRLDLYPDRTYVVSSWCDICPPTAHEYGRWESDGREVHLQALEQVAPGPGDFEWKGFLRLFGDLHSLRFFVTLKGDQIDGSFLLPSSPNAEPKDSAVELFLERQVAYPDWPTEKQKLVDEIRKRKQPAKP